MNYSSLIKTSCVDFTGWSVVLQVTGCSFRCKGCFNPKAQNPKYGQLFTEDSYQELYEAASKSYIDNIVIQGGDLMYHRNVAGGIRLCQRLRKELPDKNIVMFTGYTYNQLRNDLLRCEVLNHITYLVDGKFEISQSKNPPPYRGSHNQVIHTLIDGISVEQN